MKKSRNNTGSLPIILNLNRCIWMNSTDEFKVCPVLIPFASVKYISKAEIDTIYRKKPNAPESRVYFSNSDFNVKEDIDTIKKMINDQIKSYV